jgi:hypothetical protein
MRLLSARSRAERPGGCEYAHCDGDAMTRSPQSRFELQFPVELVPELAERYSYADDGAIQAAGRAARQRGHYSRDEFLLVCAWKSVRSRSRVAKNSDSEIERATRIALGRSDEGARMTALTSLAGVGIPTGSTLLHFADPDAYPILDVRALQSLGVLPRTVYPVAFWLDYLDCCRALAHQLGVSLRTLDKALWQHSKERTLGRA